MIVEIEIHNGIYLQESVIKEFIGKTECEQPYYIKELPESVAWLTHTL